MVKKNFVHVTRGSGGQQVLNVLERKRQTEAKKTVALHVNVED